MSQFHTGWGTFFGGVRLLWIVMIFQKDKDDKDDISTKFIVIFIIDFEIFIHLLYDKLRGLPRRVFTLF